MQCGAQRQIRGRVFTRRDVTLNVVPGARLQLIGITSFSFSSIEKLLTDKIRVLMVSTEKVARLLFGPTSRHELQRDEVRRMDPRQEVLRGRYLERK